MSKIKYLSQIFQPVITIPKGAQLKNTEITCKSQKLLAECGLVRSTSSGLFALMPLAQRALDKLEAILVKHIESTGAQRMSLPALSPASLWERTGRGGGGGEAGGGGGELLVTRDRRNAQYLLAPTHEEGVADLLADCGPLSYKQLPLLLYQIGAKFRDERRPKHGLLRAREFRMLDAYAAHAQMCCAQEMYTRVTEAYRRLFDELQLPTYAVEADVGDMGGSLSHEWQVCAAAGEDAARVCAGCGRAARAQGGGGGGGAGAGGGAAGGGGVCARCGGKAELRSTIEVGHTFVLGTRYSEALGALFTPAAPAGPPKPLIMTCYGIGTTRLLAAGVEALSDEASIRWPAGVAPFDILLIGPKEGSKEWSAGGWERTRALAGGVGGAGDVLVDDRHHLTVGKRLMAGKKLGYPNIIVCGRASTEPTPRFELHRLSSGSEELLTHSELLLAVSGEREKDIVQN